MGSATANPTGLVVIVCAPSGAGKSTIIRRVMAADPNLRFSVSCTTRKPRVGEEDGKDYYFLSPKEFKRRVKAGEFLEHADYAGNRYGTLRAEVERFLAAGQDVLLEIEVKGAAQLRATAERGWLKDHLLFVFIAPPSPAALAQRLRDRATETEDVIRRRLEIARRELAEQEKFDVVIVNDDLDRAVTEFRTVLARARAAGRPAAGDKL
jgi:guanylate kinase